MVTRTGHYLWQIYNQEFLLSGKSKKGFVVDPNTGEILDAKPDHKDSGHRGTARTNGGSRRPPHEHKVRNHHADNVRRNVHLRR